MDATDLARVPSSATAVVAFAAVSLPERWLWRVCAGTAKSTDVIFLDTVLLLTIVVLRNQSACVSARASV